MGTRNQVKPRDIDGGWAWVVLIAAVTCTFIHVGSLRSFGVLHIELLELFGESDSRTGLVSFTLNLVATCVALPAGMMADRYSPRIIVMVGAFFAALGIGLTAVAPNLDTAIVTMGAITGGGIEFVAVATIITLNKYFCKRRALANGIAMAGASLGNLVLPPLIEVIVREYAFRGTIIILSGLWAHLLIVGAVLRPIKVDTSNIIQDSEEKKYLRESEEVVEDDKLSLGEGSISDGIVINVTPTDEGDVCNDDTREIVEEEEIKQLEKKQSFVDSIPERKHSLVGSLLQGGHVIMGSVHSLNTMCKIIEAKTPNPPDENKKSCISCGKNKGNNEICELLKMPSILQIGFMVAMGCLAIFTGLYTLPLLSLEIGESKFRGSILLSIAGGCDLVSRVVLGIISDLPQVSKPMVVKISFLLCGVLGLVMCSFYSFVSLGALAVILGCLGSNHMLLLGPILIECVGSHRLGAAMGLVSIPMGLATAIGPPLLGAVKEATGTYYAAARVLLICFILGFLVYFVDKDLIRMCKSRFGKSKETKDGIMLKQKTTECNKDKTPSTEENYAKKVRIEV